MGWDESRFTWFMVSGFANQEFVWSWEEKQNGEIQFSYITLLFSERFVTQGASCMVMQAVHDRFYENS